MKKTILLFLSVAFGSNLFSQTASATWSLTSNGNASITGNITATAVIAGPGRYTPGIGPLSYNSDGVRSQNWNRASYTQFSITSQFYNQDYYQYTVSPTVGNDFNINSITLQASASASTPSWYVFYSLDGFTTSTQIGGRNSTSLTGLNIDIPSGSTLTLRVFGMDLVANTTYFRNKNVVISGTTSSGCSNPDQPSAIGGNTTLCANGSGTYSVTNDPNATSYTWTLPSGWSGTSTTNSINVTANETGGTITVTANNTCGSSTPQTMAVTTTDIGTSLIITDITCHGAMDGTITVSTIGGTPPYDYGLNGQSSSTSTYSNLPAGTYIATITDQNGCIATSNLATITEPPVWDASLIVTDVTCHGESNGTATVFPTGGVSPYNYSLNSQASSTPNYSNLPAGSYVATITDQNGCVVTTNIAVITEPAPATVSLNGITLTAEPAGASYQWLNCDNSNSPIIGETSQSFTPVSNGNYAVELTINGCTDTTSCTVVNFVNISENVIDNLTVFPNPGNGIYTISGYNFQGDADIKIYTADGKTILHESSFSGKDAIITIDITRHPQGIYLIEIDNHKSVFHSRIVKQ